jgi:hypothetical protein
VGCSHRRRLERRDLSRFPRVYSSACGAQITANARNTTLFRHGAHTVRLRPYRNAMVSRGAMASEGALDRPPFQQPATHGAMDRLAALTHHSGSAVSMTR